MFYSANDCRAFFDSHKPSVHDITKACYEKAKAGQRSGSFSCSRYMFLNIDGFDRVIDELNALGYRINCKGTRAFILNMDPGAAVATFEGDAYPKFHIEW